MEKDRGQDTNGLGLRQWGLGQWGSGAPLLEPAKEKAPRREWPTKGQAAGGHMHCRVSGVCGAVTRDIRDGALTEPLPVTAPLDTRPQALGSFQNYH